MFVLINAISTLLFNSIKTVFCSNKLSLNYVVRQLLNCKAIVVLDATSSKQL